MSNKTLTETDKRLFATDCAALVHHIWQRAYPNDKTVRTLIETTRRHIQHEATAEELKAAKAAADVAETAAWAAADADKDHAWDAAWETADVAAWTARNASDAVWVARAAKAAEWAAADAVEWAANVTEEPAKRAAIGAVIRAVAEVILASRREAYALGTAGELWEIDDGERLRGILGADEQ